MDHAIDFFDGRLRAALAQTGQALRRARRRSETRDGPGLGHVRVGAAWWFRDYTLLCGRMNRCTIVDGQIHFSPLAIYGERWRSGRRLPLDSRTAAARGVMLPRMKCLSLSPRAAAAATAAAAAAAAAVAVVSVVAVAAVAAATVASAASLESLLLAVLCATRVVSHCEVGTRLPRPAPRTDFA